MNNPLHGIGTYMHTMMQQLSNILTRLEHLPNLPHPRPKNPSERPDVHVIRQPEALAVMQLTSAHNSMPPFAGSRLQQHPAPVKILHLNCQGFQQRSTELRLRLEQLEKPPVVVLQEVRTT